MASPESCIVVGSGPAGAAAAYALVAAGHKPVLLDTGLTLEPEREAARRRMAATTPEKWLAQDVALTSFSGATTQGSNYKQLFGSDVAFRDDGVLAFHHHEEVGARPSYALGGLSNVWGSGLLPYTDSDLAGWPIAAGDLEAGYRAVLDFLPYAAEQDELASRYPLFRDPDGPLIRTRAGEELLDRMRRHSGALGASGYLFGAPRLAVRVGHPAPTEGCIYCGHCLDGCPYDHIYSAGQTITQLHRAGAIDYRAGHHVDRLIEDDEGVTVLASPIGGGAGATLRAERAFIAAGVVSSTVILQRSGLLPARSEILDSQALFLPLLWAGRVGRTGREPGHTLAQLSVVLEDRSVAANPVHISLYTYSPGVSTRAREAHPRIGSALGPALDSAARRLLIAICFFHSDDSDRVSSRWEEQSESVELEPVPNPGRAATIARFQRALRRTLPRIGLIPLAPFAEQAPPGGGYHYGGSAPMRSHPGFGETDTLGRPSGTRRIHVVDSSCFPCVPGGAITFSAMANSHRIASAVARDGPP